MKYNLTQTFIRSTMYKYSRDFIIIIIIIIVLLFIYVCFVRPNCQQCFGLTISAW